ncbi:hypothetical protein [Amycolatopsis suaedae]|uniref:hypothetical protein n=1 Tax=Amycolatopsis suaedae TaxID=2510978 RepID=UPI001F0FBFBD|nr:hypothetical protein [Amycolatopsis suaedae]
MSDQRSPLGPVVSALEAAGLRVDEVLEPIGVVTGSVGSGGLDGLRAVPGVSHVEEQREVGPS